MDFDQTVRSKRGRAVRPITLKQENHVVAQWNPENFSYEIVGITPLDEHKFVLDLRKSQGELANDLYHFIHLMIADAESFRNNK